MSEYFAEAIKAKEDSLEHSSGAWKSHKYIRKEGSGKDAKYYYGRSFGNNYQFRYSKRRDAEKQAADEDFWYDSDNDYALTERGRKALDFYNDQDSGVRGAVKESIATDANKRFGANGMPSNVASKTSKNANNKLNNAVIEATIKKTVKEINRQAELKERYQKKGMNGMPSSVINAMTTKVKDIG